MIRKITLLFVTLALLALPLIGLAETVASSFYPIHLLTLNLVEGIDGVEARCVAAPQTGCLHDYQLSAGDMRTLSEADVFCICGAGMEGYLEHVFEALPELKVVDASAEVPLLPSETGETEFNPHIWLSPANARIMIRNLAAGLAEAMPEHAEAIERNRAAYDARLQALDEELTAGLAPFAGAELITFHEAFPYFAEAYDMHVAAVIVREPGDALSPREIAELVETVRALGNPPLFTEPQYADLAAKTVAAETGAGVWELDPCVTGPETEIPLTYYEDVMRQNLRVLQDALSHG